MLHRRFAIGLTLLALPFATACTQTAAPANPGVPGSGTGAATARTGPAAPARAAPTASAGALAALADAEATRAHHQAQSTALGVMSIFDPVGVTDVASTVMEAEQRRVMDEKYQRVRAEVEKAAAEAEALRAANAQLAERQAKRRRRAP